MTPEATTAARSHEGAMFVMQHREIPASAGWRRL